MLNTRLGASFVWIADELQRRTLLNRIRLLARISKQTKKRRKEQIPRALDTLRIFRMPLRREPTWILKSSFTKAHSFEQASITRAGSRLRRDSSSLLRHGTATRTSIFSRRPAVWTNWTRRGPAANSLENALRISWAPLAGRRDRPTQAHFKNKIHCAAMLICKTAMAHSAQRCQ